MEPRRQADSSSPEPGGWALPGAIIKPEIDQSLDAAAARMLGAKTHVHVPYLEQVCTHSGPNRDPGGWSASTLFFALLPSDQVPAVAASKIEAIEWVNPDKPRRRLSFDHAEMFAEATAALRAKVERDALPLY